MLTKVVTWISCILLCSNVFALRQEASENQSLRQEGLAGTWHAQFETPFGLQTYHLHFTTDDKDVPSAKAEVEGRGQTREVAFVDVRIDGESITFAELVHLENANSAWITLASLRENASN